jgi:predicted MFS family arabinose efflux permease
VLTEHLGWESVFFVNVPIGLAAIALSAAVLRESRDPAARGVDWLGLVTFSAGLFLLVFALVRGNAEGWSDPLIVSFLLGAGVLLVVFVAVERAQEEPMLDLALFRKPAFAGASIVAFALSVAMFSMFLYLTLYIQNVLGHTPLETGLRFLPITLLAFLVAPVAGRLTEHLPVRGFLGVGLLLVSGGLLLMGGLSADSDWTTLIPGFVVAGAGIGMVNPPLASTAVGVVPMRRSGMGSGINTTFRQVGIATGIAGLGAVFHSRVESRFLDAYAAGGESPGAGLPGGGGFADALASGNGSALAASLPPDLRPAFLAANQEAFTGAMNDLFLIAAAVAFVGGLLGFALVRQRDFVNPDDA